jgi:hypothetical protein
MTGLQRASRLVYELALPLPPPAAFFDFAKTPDKTGSKTNRNQHEQECSIARGQDHEMSNANGSSKSRANAEPIRER